MAPEVFHQALRTLEELTRFAQTERDAVTGRSLWDKPPVRQTLVDLWITSEISQLLSYRVVSMQERGLVPNYESSINKVLTVE